jgi:hypothetical protein
MGEPRTVDESTIAARHVIALLRAGPPSLQGLTETLGLTPRADPDRLTASQPHRRDRAPLSL